MPGVADSQVRSGARGFPDKDWVSKGLRTFEQWTQLGTAALQCFAEARGLRSKGSLAHYLLRNALWRCGLGSGRNDGVSLCLGGIQVTFRPFQGELFLYKEIFLDQVYEQHPAFRLRPGWCVFDVGANIGMFTLKATCRARAARTYAFEPNPEAFSRLLTNLRENNVTTVTACAQAVGAAPGAGWYDPAGASTVGHLLLEEDQECSRAVRVEVVSLSAVVEQERIDVIHLLKLDAEGAEREVLRGAEPILGRVERIVMEYHSPELFAECERILQRHEFRKVLEAHPSYAYFLRSGVTS